MTVWYLGRAAGLVSLVAFTMATTLGAMGSSGGSRGDISRAKRRFLQQYAHRAAAVVGLGTLLVHIGSLTVLDSRSGVGPRSIVIPLSSTYRPFAVTLGALALLTIVFTAVIGATRGRLARSVSASRHWRLLHLVGYAGWVLLIGHSLLAGTDVPTPWVLGLESGCIAAVLVAVVARLNSRTRHRGGPLALARAQLASPSARRANRSVPVARIDT
jgi:methionine sulfoxide reductase heme-binding subunit